MPNDFNTEPAVNEQDAAAPNRAPKKETSQQNHEEYWIKRWEGNDVLTLKGDNPIKDLQGLTVKTAPEIFNTTATSHIGDWTRAELIFNQYKLRGIQAAQLLTTITNAICDELVVQNFNSTENIKQFIASKLEEFTNTMPLSIKDALNTFSLAEIESLLKSFNENLQTTIDEKIIKYAEKKSAANVAKQILDSIQNIFETSREIPLCEFFNKEIQISGITNNIGLKNSLPTFIQQKGILDTAQHILTWLFTRYNVKYLPTCFNEEERQIVFYYNHEEDKILGEITIPVYALHCYDDTNQFKYLNKANQLKSTMDRNLINSKNCKPLFILKINQSLTPLEDDDAKFNILSYEVKGANNFDLNNICCDAGLIPGFKNIMDELNSLDGADSQAIIKFANNWIDYFQTTLFKDSVIRTNKPESEITMDEITDTLQLTIEFYRKTNPQALIAFNKKLAALENLEPNATSSGFAITTLHAINILINNDIQDIKHTYPDINRNNDVFAINIAKRKEKFINFSNIVQSILDDINNSSNLFNSIGNSDEDSEKNKDLHIFSLTCSFTSLALTIEKMQLAENLSDFKDFLCFKLYDGGALEAWKNFIVAVKKDPNFDKEVIGYLENGVEYFESLMNPENVFKSNLHVDKYAEAIKQTNTQGYKKSRIDIIIYHLENLKDFPNYKPQSTKLSKLLREKANEEFKTGKTLKEVAFGKASQLCDEAIKLTVIQREDKFRNFSSIIQSIIFNINNTRNLFSNKTNNEDRNKNIYSLACDFASLALTIEKMQLAEKLSDFKTFLCLEEYDASALQGWKNFIVAAQSEPRADKEVVGYLEKGVKYFESLMNPRNAFKSDLQIDKYVGSMKELRAKSYTEFKANIVINPLVKQREFYESKLTCAAGKNLSTEFKKLENLMRNEAVEEFEAGKTLKQVARGEVGKICDNNIQTINLTFSNKSTAEKQAGINKYEKETSSLTTKSIIRDAITAVATAALGFIAGIPLVIGAIINSGFFSYKAKKQTQVLAKCAQEFIKPTSESKPDAPSPSVASVASP